MAECNKCTALAHTIKLQQQTINRLCSRFSIVENAQNDLNFDETWLYLKGEEWSIMTLNEDVDVVIKACDLQDILKLAKIDKNEEVWY